MAEFVRVLDDSERWTTRYLDEPKLTAEERDTAYSLGRYMAVARLYAVGPHPSAAELVRRRRKIQGMYDELHFAWLRSGRR